MNKFNFSKILGLIARLLVSICFVFVLPNVSGQQSITDWMKTAQQRIDTLRKGNFTIKAYDKNGAVVSDSISIKLKKHEFVFGCANDFDQSNYSSDPTVPSTNDWIKANMLKYFNFNVTGNAFKWSGTQPYSATSYNYGPVDSVVNWGGRTDFGLKGHTMIWGAYNDSDYHSIPKWVMQLPNNQAIYDACKTRVQSMAQRYKGKFKEYDILNEPLHAQWLITKLGSDSIYWKLFKWAREIDTVTKLYINDFNVEYNWGDANKYKALIKKMLSNGAHIDGIGVQAHFWFDNIDLAELKLNMDTLATLGLPIRFTEFDLAQMSQASQASYTSSIFRFAFSHPAFNGIISWGFWDAGVWRKESGYFDLNKNPKIAADTIYKLIHKVWTTNVSSKLATSINFKGYFGQYEVKVKFGDTWKQFSIDCNKQYKDSTFVLREQNGTAVKPQFVSAKMLSKDQLLVKFDKKMNNPLASIRAFKVFQVDPIKINSISLLSNDSSTVSIKLSTAVNKNLITVSYSDGNLKSTDGGVLEAFGPEKIDNNYTALISATTSTDGKTIVAKFNKPMLNPSAQLASFAILVNSVSAGLDSVRLKTGNDSIMVFSLSTAVKGGSTITLSYNAGSVTSKDGYELASFGNFSVLNVVPSLMLKSAGTLTGKTVEAKFNLPLLNPSAQLANFIISVNSVAASVDSVRLKPGNDSVMVFTLHTGVKKGDVVKLSYTEGGVTSKGGQKLASLSNFTVVNNVPALALVSATTSKDGRTIMVVFNKNMKDPSVQLSNFKIYENSFSVAMDSVRLKIGNDSVMVFSLSSAVKKGNEITLFYYATSGTVASVVGELLGDIRLFTVTNIVDPTGVEVQYSDGLILCPNPAKDYINLKGTTHFSKIRIADLAGKPALEKVVDGENIFVDISSLSAGPYIVSVISDKGNVVKLKMIKVK